MKLSAVLPAGVLFSAGVSAELEKLYVRAESQCNPGNNCQRGVSGTANKKPDLSSRLADCAKYNLVTVIPAASYVATPALDSEEPLT
jgi:hypothetical protein